MNIGKLIKQIDIASNPQLHELDEDELKTLHCTLVDMLSDIDKFCTENGILWSLSGGSLLGAVRHEGFIPWDDDIDIVLTRDNFEKFYSLFPKDDAKYEIKRPGDEGYLKHYPNILKKNTIAQSIQSSGDIEELFIDIFIIENAPDNLIFRTIHGFICTALLFIVSSMRMKKCQSNLLKYGVASSELIHEVKKRLAFSAIFSFLPFEKWLLISDKIFALVKNNKSKIIVIPSGTNHYFGEIYERSKITECKLGKFENKKFWVPIDYEYYLRKRYGDDYMTPPPESKKERHVYIKLELDTECNIIK